MISGSNRDSGRNGEPIGLYVHVPFCCSKCDYCGFYSVSCRGDLVDAYLKRLRAELDEGLSHDLAGRVRTVFVGGGNPTSIGAEAFGQLLQTLTNKLGSSPIEEWTIESNPETLSPEMADIARDIPGLRLSLGLQRLRDKQLGWLGRAGTISRGRLALTEAFRVTSNVGVDLILGVPEFPSLANDLRKLLSRFPLKHVSAYFLTLEADTPYQLSVAAGKRKDPADAGPEELLEVAEVLDAQGFEHYEISNFAAFGFRCRHNMNYWKAGDYLGLGPSAVGTMQGRRASNPASLEGWLAGLPPEVEPLSREIRLKEFLMLSLRLVNDGLDLDEFSRRFGSPGPTLIETLHEEVREGFLQKAGSRFRLTRQGIPLTNRIIARLF